MKKTQQFQKRLKDLKGRIDSERPVVMQAIFGENAEFGSVTFERRGGKTRVLELVEPAPIDDDLEEAEG